MKLIVQADDYAMTDAVAEGILKCARDGILTQTGLMTNGPHADYYAKRMVDENPHIALGLEINLVSGRPLSDPKDIPTLVDKEGKLLKSGYHRRLDQNEPEHVCYMEAYREIENQIKKFFVLIGKKPCFIGLHSYQNKVMLQALKELEIKYDLDDAIGIMNKILSHKPQMGPWYPLYTSDKNSLDYRFQLSFDPVEMFLNGECAYITDRAEDDDAVCMLHTHAGYVDKDLLDMSTLTMTRLIELNLLCDSRIRKWIENNNVELINMQRLEG